MTAPASGCIFCAIAAGTTAAYIVLEDESSVAFLDHRPLFKGHCLLIPRRHYQTFAELPAALLGPFFRNAQLLARAMELGLGADGSFVAVNNRVSQSVPHLHVHVVPRRRKDGLRGFFWPRQRYGGPDDMASVQAELRGAIERLRREEGG